ncbi:50S ribosomal protein L9 [Kingella kingae]|uniref:50S ribosomal protein L9 n=1 Tax=Kingella kingae TaxID=504 RepID=UPI0006681034|nr:50S ribosomal protein L9 [Kingella kingae]
MQIILLERVAGLGNLGDVVTVKNGYARNFLIPTGKAKRATEANLKEFEARRAELEARQAAILADAQARKAKLDGQTITVAQKAGVDGRLFGSVTNADIADAIKATGVEVVKADVRLPNGPLKAVGEYEVELALHADAVASITVAVVVLLNNH